MQVRGGFKGRAHASRQRVHLIRTAAPLDLTSIALHAHLLARQIQRKRLKDFLTRIINVAPLNGLETQVLVAEEKNH